MNKRDLAAKLARSARLPKAAAADEVDRLVHQMLLKLRSGQTAPVPGVGTLVRDPKGGTRLKPEDK